MSWVAVAPPAARRVARWSVSADLRDEPLGNGKRLVLDAETGAWVVLDEDGADTVTAVLEAVRRGLLPDDAVAEEVLAPLVASGVVRDARHPLPPHRLPEAPATSMLILKLVGYCNMACTYCYDFDDDRYRMRMSFEDGHKAIVGALAEAPTGLTILFHGGEPLLAFDLLRRLTAAAVDEAGRLGKPVQFSIQTNGTRFTEEAAAFLIEHRFSVGLSVDGPPALNDILRIDHGGRGRSDQILAGLARDPQLREQVGALTTVTRHNVGRLVEIAAWVRDLGIKAWDVSHLQRVGRAAELDLAPDPDDVVAAYMELLDAVEAGLLDGLEVAPVLHYVRNVLEYSKRNMCLRGGGCGAARELVSLAVDGTIEACDCIKDESLSLGRIGETAIGDALRSEPAQRVRARTELAFDRCRDCAVRAFCGGTCLAMAGGLDRISELECALALAMYPEIFRRLARSSALEDYARRHP